MAGEVFRAVAKTTYDFASMAVGTSLAMPLGEPIDALQYTDAILVVRVHAVTITGTNDIRIGLFPDGFLEGSGVAYFGTLPIVTPDIFTVQVLTSLAGLVPPVAVVMGGQAVGPALSVGLQVNRLMAGSLSATVSVDVCMRNPDESIVQTQ